MLSFLAGLLIILLILFGAVITFIFIVIPVIGLAYTFIGRLIRFGYQELRDVLLIPIALLVGIIKLLRATICVVLARWDIVHIEMTSAKRRFVEAYDRTVAVFIDNPLRIFGIDSSKQATLPNYMQGVESVAVEAAKQYKKNFGGKINTPNKFDGYKVVGTLPSGGSGAKIYIVQPINTSSKIVIKCFDISDGSQLPQIVRESRSMEAAKKLGLIIEHHLDNERFWYAMPYHEGDHLGVVTALLHGTSSHLTAKNLRTVLLYQQTLLQTLREYHRAGLWHKDVKPDNIIVHDGKAHLVDLGLVTPLASAMTLTTHGTEYFRDSELVRQAMRGVKVHQVDGSKFDVFSAGAVLYFMLENTFPPHGGLSGFNKNSPEGVRWIVRRAMSDYDKRYASVEEMLADVETILHSKDISSVRPADLPSMTREPIVLDDVVYKKSIPLRSTPSTGGGPFSKVYVYKTKPLGIVVAFIVAGLIIYSTTSSSDAPLSPQNTIANISTSIFDHTRPNGRVLLLDDCAMASDPEVCKEQMTIVAKKLTACGWDVFTDEQLDARSRVWIPEELNTTPEVAAKLEHEQLAAILVMQEGVDNTILASVLEHATSTQYVVDVE